jgi:transposase
MSPDASKARGGDWFWHVLITCLVTLGSLARVSRLAAIADSVLGFRPRSNTKKTMTKNSPTERRAAGIDVGSEQLFVAVGPGSVRVFSSFTASLMQLKDYLLEQQVTTVAMEATGVYWLPAYEVLEEAGLEVCVVNAAHARNLPARKTDMKDCQWLAELHAKQMLNSGFIPPTAIRELRDYTRLRQDHLEMGCPHILHMQKALDQMNLKIHEVLSDLTGVSGQRLVQAIIDGVREREMLVALCDPQVLKHKRQRMLDALEGRWKPSQLFALRQAYENWQHYQKQIAACDQQIALVLERLAPPAPGPTGESEAKTEVKIKSKRLQKNAPVIANLDQLMVRITGGQDLSQLPCLTSYSIMQIVAEVGTDMAQWKDAKHFTAWLGVAPGSRQSGKSRKSQPRFRGKAGRLFCAVAQSLAQSKYLALGGFYRRVRGRRGGQIANIAAARKLAVLFYNTLRFGWDYVEQGLVEYEKKYKEQYIKRLRSAAKHLGMQLVPEPTTA